MKKIFIFLFILLFSLSINSENIFKFNKTVEFGIHYGVNDYNNENVHNIQTFMFNTAIYGIYIDIGGRPRSHVRDVNIDIWQDEQCFACHIGYQIPIMQCLKITPLIGYYDHQLGFTDGNYWTVNNYGIRNKFVVLKRNEGIDYGGQIQFNIKCTNLININIIGTLTNNMWYGGLGIGLNFNRL